MKSILRLVLPLLCGTLVLCAQGDPRGAIFGHVTDPSTASLVGAKVTVKNTLTGVTTELVTNEQGYFEAQLLIAGTYEIVVAAPGFRNASRPAFNLPAGSRLEVNFKLEIGSISDAITVVDTPPLLNADNASAGLVLERRDVQELPWPGGNPMMLIWMAPGAQTSLSIADYSQRLHSGGPANNVNINGKVGGNDFTIDGTSNNANGRGVAFNPAPEFVQAVKVETSGFDASFGHSTGAGISMMTNSGTNQFHGVLREMHEQYSWRAADLFAKQNYYTQMAKYIAAGDTAGADSWSKTKIIQPGRENSYAASIGGPVIIPKLFDGKNKLFFFFGYAGFRVGEYRTGYNAFPTTDMRGGNFSQLLNINANQYQIYDPYSTVADSSRSGHVVRTPFAGNIVPSSRIINPAYKWMSSFLPTPNTLGAANVEPNRDFTVFSSPYTEKYNSYINRYDYNISDRDRVFFRWSVNRWQNMNSTWYYYATPDIWNGAGNIRTNYGLGADWVHNFGSRTLLDVAIGSNLAKQENMSPALENIKPSDIGYPAYLDQKVSGAPNLPAVSWSGWTSFSVPSTPSISRWRVLTFKADLSHMRAAHTWKAGFDARGQFYTGYSSGNSAGTFSYTNAYTQRTDDGQGAAGTGNYGSSWAAFMMGLPTSASADVNASQVYGNPYYAAYVHDTWRLNSRLTLNLGLRMEYELGPTERYDRLIGPFDSSVTLPITASAQAAYAKSPIPEVPVSQFNVLGGATYPNVGGANRRLWQNYMSWMPRVSVAYQFRPKTVLRAGYGIFIDTLNVQNEGFNQLGFSWATNTSYTTDFGQSWLVGNPAGGVSPASDPFPTRTDGSRFDTPPGSKLGAMAPVGRGFTFAPYDRPHARQQRARLDIQHQLTNTMVLNVGYAGSYSDNLTLNQSLSALPAQYWWFGSVRNDTVANFLNANLTNPYNIKNFADIKASNPALYQLMNTNSFFTSGTIRKSAILSPNSHMNTLTQTTSMGKVKTHELDVSLQRRFANGSNFAVSYTKLYNYAADYLPNPFDASPAWQPSNQGRPHRLTSTAVAELPFGKGRRWLTEGPLSWIAGGFQVTMLQEYQPGQLLTWGSTLFYSGSDYSAVCDGGPHSIAQWFDTTGFTRVAAQAAANAGQARVFPNMINGYGGCRGDSMKRVNGSLQREFKIKERNRLVLRWDVYNVANHGQLALPNVTPTSTDFGKITSSFNGGGGAPSSNRSMRIIARFLF